ncbi:DnaA N-terminal domain-containing protein, partial [Clostridium putrefaciens]|uniref:DnaA N-terminal domain-containing protein n=1 Tax=Clostridium putrefaciens TaxID=99675 RepID=UPI00241CE6D9
MNAQLKEMWEKTLNILKGELSEVSFNTWIKSAEPMAMDDKTVRFGVPNDFTREILESRYKDLIMNGIKLITSKKYNIEFYILSDDQAEEEVVKESIEINKRGSVIPNDE